MKKVLCILLCAVTALTFFVSCSNSKNAVYKDGRARPSSCGSLKVVDGKLCSQKGEPVMLRGVSINGLVTSEALLNEELFKELSKDVGANLFRIANYTYGVGIVGYCTGGNKERHKEDIARAVELAKKEDMYAIIDWHILRDGNPNTYIEDAKEFFTEMAQTYSDYNNVLYEICNEPNGVEWEEVKSYAEEIIPIIRRYDSDSVIIVGNPDWSKDLYTVSDNPLDFDNIMYTFHFYAATHKDDFRTMVKTVSHYGLPVFVTEFGVTAASGGHPRDLESADEWIELLEEENISYCMWAWSKAPEACSTFKSNVPKTSGFEKEDYTESGIWLLETLEKRNSL